MQSLLKSNFQINADVKKDESPPDPKDEFRKKALESIGGSMVFVERTKLYHDPEVR